MQCRVWGTDVWIGVILHRCVMLSQYAIGWLEIMQLQNMSICHENSLHNSPLIDSENDKISAYDRGPVAIYIYICIYIYIYQWFDRISLELLYMKRYIKTYTHLWLHKNNSTPHCLHRSLDRSPLSPKSCRWVHRYVIQDNRRQNDKLGVLGRAVGNVQGCLLSVR